MSSTVKFWRAKNPSTICLSAALRWIMIFFPLTGMIARDSAVFWKKYKGRPSPAPHRNSPHWPSGSGCGGRLPNTSLPSGIVVTVSVFDLPVYVFWPSRLSGGGRTIGVVAMTTGTSILAQPFVKLAKQSDTSTVKDFDSLFILKPSF